jgi:glucose-1-phosphate thymidylyltransferase
MMQKGMKFVPGTVEEWMDCGNKNVTVETNARMLGFLEKDGESLVSSSVKLENSLIIEPCFIGENVILHNSTVGPFVSIGNDSIIENCTIKNSLVQCHNRISNAILDNAMIGNHVVYNGNFETISIGDYSTME